MSRYVLAPEARTDLQEIRNFYVAEAGIDATRRVLAELRTGFLFLARNHRAGHYRRDLTERAVCFWAVRSYLVVYWPETNPLEIVAVLHGARDVQRILGRQLGVVEAEQV
ncbi:MAG TPA: type II toxin-antitoxin system RelE/ParE family toxin [Bryobacterales bacterium]|nr:type II toxin-antitoxin system RelE/ParE family toxin [Bryobacterales bacterium]